MPYIKNEDRPKFQEAAKNLGNLAECAGDLNYIITEMVHEYIKKKGVRYSNINEVVGALECCKLELYRKVAAPYEEIKITENGDVGLNQTIFTIKGTQTLIDYIDSYKTYNDCSLKTQNIRL